ncbi:MAG: hypothetical protein ACXWDO_05120 [Bacteroidia bacterium]
MIISIIQYFQPWDFMRRFRLAVAIGMFAGAAYYMQLMPVLIGGLFLYQAFTNTGCCNGGSCAVPVSKQKQSNQNHKNSES